MFNKEESLPLCLFADLSPQWVCCFTRLTENYYCDYSHLSQRLSIDFFGAQFVQVDFTLHSPHTLKDSYTLAAKPRNNKSLYEVTRALLDTYSEEENSSQNSAQCHIMIIYNGWKNARKKLQTRRKGIHLRCTMDTYGSLVHFSHHQDVLESSDWC